MTVGESTGALRDSSNARRVQVTVVLAYANVDEELSWNGRGSAHEHGWHERKAQGLRLGGAGQCLSLRRRAVVCIDTGQSSQSGRLLSRRMPTRARSAEGTQENKRLTSWREG